MRWNDDGRHTHPDPLAQHLAVDGAVDGGGAGTEEMRWHKVHRRHFSCLLSVDGNQFVSWKDHRKKRRG